MVVVMMMRWLIHDPQDEEKYVGLDRAVTFKVFETCRTTED
jgi:hypothetical protein